MSCCALCGLPLQMRSASKKGGFGSKKTVQSILEETGREVEGLIGRLIRDFERQGGFDFEAMETAVREQMHRCGAIMIESLLALENGESLDESCTCGGVFHSEKRVSKIIHTILGEIRLLRTYQRCDSCGERRVPEDRVLDVEGTGFSPGMRRMMAKTGSMVCFDKARDLLRDLAGARVTDKEVERVAERIGADIQAKEQALTDRIMKGHNPECAEAPKTLYISADGTGVPVLKRETEGRKGKGEDGIARTREVKLGAIFTQTGLDKEGKPMRDEASTTYVGQIQDSASFGEHLFAEAKRRGMMMAAVLAVLGDGAAWIWNLAAQYYPRAIQIVDFYHAKEHLAALSKILFPSDEEKQEKWIAPLGDRLWVGDIEAILGKLRRLAYSGNKGDAIRKEINYFETNKERMRYFEFRKRGLFIGSGVVEAGCKAVIGQRLKQSGMHWSVKGANAIIALRCCVESGKFEDYWADRRAA
jgi:hypothetical protein